MVAQALLERGLIEGVITGIGTLLGRLSFAVQEHPWLWIVIALVLAVLIQGGGGRRSNF